ncbi:MAG: PAS domain S-box protein [Candidatus Thorarchaeota archaeon]|jgi:PAS domain S-box-containing protein
MRVIETLEMMGERLQVAMVVCEFPTDGSGDLNILYTNAPASYLFGYASPKSMVGLDVRSLMPESIAKDHQSHVKDYQSRADRNSAHTVRRGSIMGTWRDLEGVKQDGSMVSLQANVADIKNSEERYFIAIFRDRTSEVAREDALKQSVEEMETLRKAAEAAKEKAESALLKEKKLTGQITLLRQIFTGTVGLVGMLGLLIVASWLTGNQENNKDALAMIERVLLVMTGILGSAMASVFDSKNKSD